MKTALAATLCLVASTAAKSQAEDKYHITPEERAACQADATVLCSATFPDEDRLIACMRQNRARLSPDCLKSFSMGLRRRHMS